MLDVFNVYCFRHAQESSSSDCCDEEDIDDLLHSESTRFLLVSCRLFVVNVQEFGEQLRTAIERLQADGLVVEMGAWPLQLTVSANEGEMLLDNARLRRISEADLRPETEFQLRQTRRMRRRARQTICSDSSDGEIDGSAEVCSDPASSTSLMQKLLTKVHLFL